MSQKLDRDDVVKRLELRSPIYVQPKNSEFSKESSFKAIRLSTNITSILKINQSIDVIMTKVGGSDYFTCDLNAFIERFDEI